MQVDHGGQPVKPDPVDRDLDVVARGFIALVLVQALDVVAAVRDTCRRAIELMPEELAGFAGSGRGRPGWRSAT